MNCPRTEEIAHYYKEGKANPDPDLEAHLAECETCRDQLSFLQGFRAALKQVEAQPYPPEVERRLQERIDQERATKVVSFPTFRVMRYLAAALVLGFLGMGLVQSAYTPEAPASVAALVEHHDTCWHIAPSDGRKRQYQQWTEKLKVNPPVPQVSKELVAFDQRECPAGEVRAGHLLYHHGDEKISVYILPAEEFLSSHQGKLAPHRYDGRQVALRRQGEWVYGVVADEKVQDLKSLVNLEAVARVHHHLLALSAWTES